MKENCRGPPTTYGEFVKTIEWLIPGNVQENANHLYAWCIFKVADLIYQSGFILGDSQGRGIEPATWREWTTDLRVPRKKLEDALIDKRALVHPKVYAPRLPIIHQKRTDSAYLESAIRRALGKLGIDTSETHFLGRPYPETVVGELFLSRELKSGQRKAMAFVQPQFIGGEPYVDRSLLLVYQPEHTSRLAGLARQLKDNLNMAVHVVAAPQERCARYAPPHL